MQLTSSDQGVIAVTSGGDLLAVGNDAGNTVAAAIVAMGVDLSVNLTSTLPVSAMSGAKGTASVAISEVGTALASGKFAIQLFVLEDGASATNQFPLQTIAEKLALNEGQDKIIRVKYQYPASLPDGNYHLAATINTGTARDLNLNNNTSASRSTVLIAAPFVQLVGSGLTTPTFNGSKPEVVSFTVMNAGNATASTPSAVQFLASTSGALSGAVSVGTTPLRFNLKPSAVHVFKAKISLPAGFPPGMYILLALLDPSNVFNDPDSATNFIASDNTFVVG